MSNEELTGMPPGAREERAIGLLRRTAAEFLEIESNKTALITVTRVNASKDMKRAVIYITVLPDSKEEEALKFARRRLSDFREYVKKKTRMRIIPFFTVEIDKGEKNRQRIDEISNNN